MKKNEKKTEAPAVAAAERTVPVYVPGDGNGTFLEGALNGVNFRIPTDRIVEVPERIARILSESRSALTGSAVDLAEYAASGGRRIG